MAAKKIYLINPKSNEWAIDSSLTCFGGSWVRSPNAHQNPKCTPEWKRAEAITDCRSTVVFYQITNTIWLCELIAETLWDSGTSVVLDSWWLCLWAHHKPLGVSVSSSVKWTRPFWPHLVCFGQGSEMKENVKPLWSPKVLRDDEHEKDHGEAGRMGTCWDLALGSEFLNLWCSLVQVRNSHLIRGKLKPLIPVKGHTARRHDPWSCNWVFAAL